MFSCFLRFLLLVIVCLAITHAYPSSMNKARLTRGRISKPYVVVHDYDYPNENDIDQNDSNGFATWLFRSRKFCCAPPL